MERIEKIEKEINQLKKREKMLEKKVKELKAICELNPSEFSIPLNKKEQRKIEAKKILNKIDEVQKRLTENTKPKR